LAAGFFVVFLTTFLVVFLIVFLVDVDVLVVAEVLLLVDVFVVEAARPAPPVEPVVVLVEVAATAGGAVKSPAAAVARIAMRLTRSSLGYDNYNPFSSKRLRG
jgi:hypothetical protein